MKKKIKKKNDVRKWRREEERDTKCAEEEKDGERRQ